MKGEVPAVVNDENFFQVNYVVKKEDLEMDYVVEAVRNTMDQHTLRDCLRLLAAAVKVSPVI